MLGVDRYRRYLSPRAILFSVSFTSVFLLFFTAFSIPYVNTVYFVKASGTAVFTLGTFGFCYEYAGLTSCSSGALGYHLSWLDLTNEFLPTIPFISTAITSALSLHIAAFVVSLLATTVILCNIWHTHGDPLGNYIFHLVSLLIIFNFSSFAVDLALFFEVKKAFGAAATTDIGNGAWLTLVSLLLLILGLVYHQQRHTTPLHQEKDVGKNQQDVEAAWPPKGKKVITAATMISDDNVFPEKPTSSVTALTRKGSNGSQDEICLTPVRRLPSITINDSTDASNSTAGQVMEPIEEHTVPETEDSRYAPSSYYTYSSRSSMSNYTSSSLSRSTTSSSAAFTRFPARRSTLNPHAFEHLVPATRYKKGKRRTALPHLSYASSSSRSSLSTVHPIPNLPGTPQSVHIPFSLQYRDRFIENNPSISMDARSFTSAAPSSDIELDIQTIPPSSPVLRSSARKLPPVPAIPLDAYPLA